MSCRVAHDARRICAMHLSRRLPADKMIWKYFRNGIFWVKTAYYTLKRQTEVTYTNNPSSSSLNEAWKKLWNLRILPKIKHFSWRACLNALPTKDKMLEKNMATDPVCAICGDGTETLNHLILECRETLPVWIYNPIRIDTIKVPFGSYKNFLWCQMNSSPAETVEFICITAWCIWTARNSFYFDHTPFNAEQVRLKAQNLFLETHGRKPPRLDKEHTITVTAKWKPPAPGVLKLNTDAALFNEGDAGLGFILRDHAGRSVLAGAKRTMMEGSSIFVEGMAILFALRSINDAGLHGFEVESDCKILVDGLQGKDIPDTHRDLICEDILGAAKFSGCINFIFTLREANKLHTP
ncbi:hypothetical protein DH2020_009092 [Rehmannia glutinosa]|uniref:Uncharacterized protein n=1 Tax=Rehmannia glutinosa TaxID=99300 RepID=A0ABR0X8H3_REHGL